MMAAAAAPMEAQTAQPPSDASSAAYPRWAMLQKDLRIQVDGSSSSTSGDSKTLAAARTSTGHLIQVSLLLAEPPGVSCVCLLIPDRRLDATFSRVVAAHGDSVLIQVCIEEKDPPRRYADDHFVYNAGAAAAADSPRPPTMSLLPPSGARHCPTGLVRRGDDLVVVGSVEIVPAAGPDTPELTREADLSLLRSGEWIIKRLQIRFPDAIVVPTPDQLRCSWHTVVPMRDGLICWVDLCRHGVLLCDVFKETPRLQYLRLPWKNTWGPASNQNVCATAGGDTLKFVNIFPRCCCGGPGESSCQRSCHAYTIETWTMRIGGGDDDGMEWVMDAVVDSTEFWALSNYKGLRRLPLHRPVVSLDQPDLICFWLHEPPTDGPCSYDDTTVDVLMINTRSKTIHSVSRYEDGLRCREDGLIPSNVSYFFNSCPGSGRDATFPGQRQEDIERPLPVIVDDQLIRDNDASNPTLQLASFDQSSMQVSEILEVFQEIPSYVLDHDEVEVYRILRHDNCRRFRSLLRLPKNLRKDWLLMEIRLAKIDLSQFC